MKLTSITSFLNIAFQYVIQTSKKYGIDESHGLKHSMDVLHYSNQIYQSEVTRHPYLKTQKEIIFASSILHDMCDKKYMDETNGILEMRTFLEMNSHLKANDLDIISKIVSTMSYSTVKKNGFPNLGEYQLAYHIVREADLLAAYDLERCVIYKIMKQHHPYSDAVTLSLDLFKERVLLYIQDNLFVTAYSKSKAQELQEKTLQEIEFIDLLY